jgi:hypothetical protein
MSKAEIKIENKGQPKIKVTITGFIDEAIKLSDYPIKDSVHIDFYLGKMKGINSCGIKEWVAWMGTAPKAVIVFHECPKTVVDQINMVRGFLPQSGTVKSFYAPYYSDDSGTEKNVLLTAGVEVFGSEVKLPAQVKDDKGNVMELDVSKESYFKFLSKRP